MRTDTTPIDNTDDVIDSRDVIARIAHLTDLAEDCTYEEVQELNALEALQAEAEGYAADWRHGEALIRDTHFEDYARELADDIGAVPADATWPNNCIDWAEAARQLQQDYTSVDFAGVTYWIR